MSAKPRRVGTFAVELEGEALEYELLRSDRKTVGITVTPDARLLVTAPKRVRRNRVEGVLHHKAGWILRNLRSRRELTPPVVESRWVSGETHHYLGRQYRLKIRNEFPPGLRRAGLYFEIGKQSAPGPATVEKLVKRWYLEEAKSIFALRIERLVAEIPALELDAPPPMIVRTVRTRWGSCSSNGNILMNVETVKLPIPCIDYVLVHELCHLKHLHHGKEFWRHVTKCMPDWERWHNRIQRFGL